MERKTGLRVAVRHGRQTRASRRNHSAIGSRLCAPTAGLRCDSALGAHQVACPAAEPAFAVRHAELPTGLRTQKANHGELKRKPQPVVITTLGIDQPLIGVIEMEVARQLIRGRVTNVSTIVGTLFGSEKLYGHRIASAPLHKRSFAQRGRANRPERRCAVHKGIAK